MMHPNESHKFEMRDVFRRVTRVGNVVTTSFHLELKYRLADALMHQDKSTSTMFGFGIRTYSGCRGVDCCLYCSTSQVGEVRGQLVVVREQRRHRHVGLKRLGSRQIRVVSRGIDSS